MTLSAQLRPVVEKDAAIKFTRAVDRVTQQLDRTVPVKTGKTKRSRRVSFTTGRTLSALVEYTTPQADFTDKGTRPHTIRPRRAKVLRFVVGGRVVFARVVHHPGSTKHKGWFTNVTNAAAWRSALNGVFGR